MLLDKLVTSTSAIMSTLLNVLRGPVLEWPTTKLSNVNGLSHLSM